ncbi:MAG: hypothetical protein ACOYJ6_12170 [Caulobacterales bacterium]|jgi:hypothetical protein
MDPTALLPLILQAVGGAILGPVVAGLLRGREFGLIGNVLAGIVGGVAAGQGLNAAGWLAPLAEAVGGGQAGVIVSSLVSGGLGGGLLSGLAGLIVGKPG